MKRVGRAVEFLAWALFFAFALLVLAMRFWLLPDIERYRDQIVEQVSRSVGRPVRIASIEAGWLGLNPRINLRDVRILDREGREALVLPTVENVLSWSSLAHGRLKVHSLAVEGLKVQVRRDAEGALYVGGTRLGADTAFSDWALAQDEIVLRNAEVEWHDERRGAAPLVLSSLNLRLRNSGRAHSIGLTARPPAELGSSVELRALLEGDTLAEPGAWKGTVYAELGYTDLAAWRAWIDYPLQLDQGQGAVRAWLALDGGELRRATADVAFAGVSVRLGKELTPLRLASLQGRLTGQHQNGRYQISGRGLSAAVQDGPSIAPGDFQLAWSRDGGGSFAAAAIEIEPLAQLAGLFSIEEATRKKIEAARPRGRLEEARLDWKGAVEAPTAFAARGRFSGLALAAQEELPGFAGFSGSFEATDAGARIVLATSKAELDLPALFPQPRVALDFLNGAVELERQGESGFTVRSSSLNVSNAHFSGNVNGSYSRSGEGPGSIDLSAQFNRADAAHIAKYLPNARLMAGGGDPARGERLREWLVKGVLAGQFQDVRLRLRGELRDFPFTDPLRGQFSVVARVEKGVLSYAEGWPRIEDISGELRFERDRMHVVGRSAVTQGVALSNVQASMALRAAAPLSIQGQAEGAGADFLKFIHETPVRRMIAGATDPMSATGRGRLRLKLDVPLNDPPKTRVAGEYEFLGGSMVVHPQLPAIEQLAGRLAFTESTLGLSDVRGRLLGGAVAVNGNRRADGVARFVARGEATVAGARAVFDHPWRQHLSGQASYTATVSVAKGRTQVVVESPLQGVASALPVPLAKSAAETLPLRLEVLPDDRLVVRVGRIVAADLLRRRQGEALVVQRAGVMLTPASDTAPVRLPARAGTLVSGSLPALNLDKWLPLLAGPQGASDTTAFDVRVGTLDLFGKRANDVVASGSADAAGWSAKVNGRELEGQLSFRKEAGGRLVARLARFSTPDDYPGAPARGSAAPKELPSMDLAAERFTFRGKQLGRVELQATRAGDDWRIEKLAMANPEANLAATGVWRGGTPTRSQLDFELHAADAGQFLARVGFPGLVKGGKTQLKGSLAWNGEPAQLDYPSLSGELQLQAQDGQFLEIEPGIGKLISLMSLQSLPRRIALDFRDVFSKGFEFDRIGAQARIDSGVMAVNEFSMRGSAAQVSMRGELDLVRETQNLRVRVVPSLGDSASTVIALVNPLLAIPAAIAQKILKDPLGHIFAFDYSVTGGWSDPKVAKLGVEARSAEAPQSAQ